MAININCNTQITADRLNIIDDALFRKMAEDIAFCEEVVSTILEKSISIIEVTEQKDIKNLQGRSVILDALCTDADGKLYNIEVQNANNDDHQKRVRYNGACITTNFSETGEKFLSIPDVVVILISRFDIFKSNKTVYHIDRIIRETGAIIDNGFSEIYVNAAIDDGSKIAKLMDIFTDVDKYDFELFPKTSARKQKFKLSEGGKAEMCEIVEEYAKEQVSLKIIEIVDNCAKNLNVDIGHACQALNISPEEYAEARAISEKAMVNS